MYFFLPPRNFCSFFVHFHQISILRLNSQLCCRNFLHLVDGDGAVHVHGGLVGLVAEEILNPLGAEAFLFEKAGDGVAEDGCWGVTEQILDVRLVNPFANVLISAKNAQIR
jgi:hypothetical protein